MRATVVPQAVTGLALALESVPPPDEPGLRDIVFRGTLADVQEHFHAQHWTDGLPIIPPTIDRVEEFLHFIDRSADEDLGVLLPERRHATIWNVAVNGVMAGCRPEYMPILVAIAEAIADPDFRIEDGGSTPGWEPLVTLNGPLIKELDFNSGPGVMRVGSQANTSIGRFLRLYMRNVPGLRPGETDKGTIGAGFNVVLAENEDACAELGWLPYSVEQGFAAGENVVTVRSVVAVSPPVYSGGHQGEGHARVLARYIGSSQLVFWSLFAALIYRKWFPLFVLSPMVAGVLARDGWSKADLRRYLYENARVRAGDLEEYVRGSGITGQTEDYSLQGEVEHGAPAHYAESDDPDRMVRAFFSPESIGIIVAGDPARNQSRAYMNNHEQGPPVSKRVQLPARWTELRAGTGTS
jgi:hypothetical protein